MSKNKNYKPPAEGEKNAVSGYYNQYCVSSYIILKNLRLGNLKWIKIVDTEAKKLDDFQIASQNKIDAYQIKWHSYSGMFTFTDLKNLIKQLAEGWKQLKENNSGKRVVAHFITSETPSVTKLINCNSSKCHFAAFFEESWKQFKKTGTFSEKWQIPWEELKKESGLKDEFENFVHDCELEFGYEYKLKSDIENRENFIFKNDLKHVTKTLFETVANKLHIIELNRDELLEKLGWDRADFRNIHEFPIDENIYYPIESSVSELKNAINDLSGGYITVLGTPGSGKSTLLSKVLRSLENERVIFYYSYVPESYNSNVKRGESENFLHDIVLSINNEGFHVGQTLNFDRYQLLDYFFEQLTLLHNDWEKTGQKTIILIDGLDHITREEHPERSLLYDLPHPDQIQEGVYFVLGSQTDSILPNKIKNSLKGNRKIVMEALSKLAVFEICDKIEIHKKISFKQKQKIYDLSDGHPLALFYILNSLKVYNNERIDKILSNTQKYTGDIEDQYSSYWEQIEDEYELKELLGLLCRLRNVLDISWIDQWADPKTLDLFSRKFAQYFKIEKSNHWYFFHNSFRLFLQNKTIELSGNILHGRDRKYHQKLGDICSKTDDDSYYAWEEIYHRFKAENYEKVLEIASQDYFRNQFFSFRSVKAINIDINIALESAAISQNPVALTRLLLIYSEIAERDHNLNIKSIISILLKLEKIQTALDYVYIGNKLRISPKNALELVPNLIESNLNNEARKIFELSEPLYILNSKKTIENDFQDKKTNVLKVWSNVAIYYRDLDEIIKITRQIKVIDSRFSLAKTKKADPSRSLQNEMLFNTGIVLLKNERWNDLNTILNSFKVDQNDFEALFYLFVNSWSYSLKSGHDSKAKEFIGNLEEKMSNVTLIDYNMLIRLSEAFCFILKDKERAKKLIKDIPQPALRTDLFGSSSSMEPFMYRFKLNRLHRVLGSDESPEKIIPEPEKFELKGIVEFERSLCTLAYIWADSWMGKPIDPTIITEKISKFFHLFYINNREATGTYFYNIKEKMGSYCQLIIESISKHGLDHLKILVPIFEQHWNNRLYQKFWSGNVRRQVIMTLVNNGIEHSWACEELKKVENRIWEGYNVYGRVDECLKQSKAWLVINKPTQSYESLKKMFKISFGIYHEKDYQLSEWIRWLENAIQVHPERAEELISFFAEHIVLIDEFTDVKSCFDASKELLSVTFRWNPLKAIELSSWLLDQMIISQEDILIVFLNETLKVENEKIIPSLLLVSNLLFPIADHPNYSIIDLLFKKIYNNFGPEKTIEAARYLISKVRIYVQKDSRNAWFYFIKKSMHKLSLNSQDAGLKDKDIQPDENDSFTYNLLKLNNSVVLDENEVLNNVSSTKDFVKLLDQESLDSHFDWDPIIIKLVNSINSEDLFNLGQIILNNKKIKEYDISNLTSIISQKLSDNREFVLAIKLGNESLKFSKPSGWGYSGGYTRIDAFKALIKADKEQFKQKVYKTLIRDIINNNVALSTVTLNLDKILPLITDEIPTKEIWHEIENHVRVLFENYPKRDFKRLKFSEEIDIENKHSIAVLVLIITCLDHPVIFISQMAMHILANLLIWNESELYKIMPKFMHKNESYQEYLIKVLEASNLKNQNISKVFQDELISSCESENFLIQQTSRNILKNYDFQSYVSESTNSLLDEVLPETFIEYFFYEIGIKSEFISLVETIASNIHLPSLKIWLAVYQLMELGSKDPQVIYLGQLNTLEALTQRLRLKLSVKTPIEKLAINSLYHVIGNLIKTKTLSNLELIELSDPSLILLSSKPRPIEIQLIDQPSGKEWVDQLDFNKFLFKIKNRIVIGEYSYLKYINWESPTEIRRNIVHPSNNDLNSDLVPLVKCLLINYAKIKIPGEYEPLLIFGDSIDNNRVKPWLALNPEIAHKLGWKLSKKGLFRWINAKGEVMAESIWWEDGLVNRNLPPLEKAGAGWVVSVSNQGFKSLEKYYDDLERTMKISRFYHDEGVLFKNSDSITTKFINVLNQKK